MVSFEKWSFSGLSVSRRGGGRIDHPKLLTAAKLLSVCFLKHFFLKRGGGIMTGSGNNQMKRFYRLHRVYFEGPLGRRRGSCKSEIYYDGLSLFQKLMRQ